MRVELLVAAQPGGREKGRRKSLEVELNKTWAVKIREGVLRPFLWGGGRTKWEEVMGLGSRGARGHGGRVRPMLQPQDVCDLGVAWIEDAYTLRSRRSESFFTRSHLCCLGAFMKNQFIVTQRWSSSHMHWNKGQRSFPIPGSFQSQKVTLEANKRDIMREWGTFEYGLYIR